MKVGSTNVGAQYSTGIFICCTVICCPARSPKQPIATWHAWWTTHPCTIQVQHLLSSRGLTRSGTFWVMRSKATTLHRLVFCNESGTCRWYVLVCGAGVRYLEVHGSLILIVLQVHIIGHKNEISKTSCNFYECTIIISTLKKVSCKSSFIEWHALPSFTFESDVVFLMVDLVMHCWEMNRNYKWKPESMSEHTVYLVCRAVIEHMYTIIICAV